MKRAVATLRRDRAFAPIILFRCLLWVLVGGLLGTGLTTSAMTPTLLAVLMTYTAAYTLIWSIRLPHFARVAERRPLLLLLDLGLSILPAWISGGWASPLLPFAFGALILPGALFHWRGALVAVTSYVIVDQIVGWSTWPAAVPMSLASPWFLLHYLRPVIAASIWPLSVVLWRWRTRRPARSAQPSQLPVRVMTPAGARRLDTNQGTLSTRELGPESGTETAWSLARPRSQTLERPPLLDLYAAIRHAVVEAEEQGMTVQLVLDAHEPTLPPGHIQLLTKAVDIGLSN